MPEFIAIPLVLLIGLMGTALLVRNVTSVEQRWIGYGFAAQLAGVTANQLMVRYVYGYSDSKKFLAAADTVVVDIRLDPVGLLPELLWLTLGMESLLEGTGSSGTSTMVGLAVPVAWLFDGSMVAVALAFGIAAFFGKVLLYYALRPHFERRLRTTLIACCFLIPSTVYWTGGLIKEAVVIACIGSVLYGVSVARTKVVLAAILVPLPLYLIAQIKPHFLLTGMIAVGATMYWRGSIKNGQVTIRPSRIALGLAVAMVGVVAAGQVSPKLALTNIVDETIELQEAGNKGGSAYSLGGGDSLQGQLAVLPLALWTGLYRPTLLDARNPQSLFNALETTYFLFLTFYAIRILRRRGLAVFVDRPALVFCAVFVLLSATGVALASANLGSLSRYRSPVVPFLGVLLTVLAADARATRSARARPPAAVRQVSTV